MKTLRSKIVKLALLFVTLTLTMSFTTKRACADYYIDNSAFPNCTIDFDITIFDNPNCGTVCLSNVPMSVAGGAILRLPCGTCTNQCDIQITITGINSGSGSAPMKDFNNATQTISGSTCGPVGISYTGGTFTIF